MSNFRSKLYYPTYHYRHVTIQKLLHWDPIWCILVRKSIKKLIWAISFLKLNFLFSDQKCSLCNARVTRSMTTRTKLSGFFWNCLTNSGYICPKTPKSCFKCQNEKKQISNFNRFRKTRHTKWLLFKTWFWTLEIGQNYMGFVCWRLLQKFQNEKPC